VKDKVHRYLLALTYRDLLALRAEDLSRARCRDRRPFVARNCRPDCLHYIHVRDEADATVRDQRILSAGGVVSDG